jgi:hypothetical protein
MECCSCLGYTNSYSLVSIVFISNIDVLVKQFCWSSIKIMKAMRTFGAVTFGNGWLTLSEISDDHRYENPCGFVGTGVMGMGMGYEIFTHDIPVPIWEGDGSVTG